MLIRLHVRNILLLENAELNFKPGLNVLTGETGAGKSILLDCLGFLLGQKSVKIDVGNDGEVGEVTGVFELKENKQMVEKWGLVHFQYTNLIDMMTDSRSIVLNIVFFQWNLEFQFQCLVCWLFDFQ